MQVMMKIARFSWRQFRRLPVFLQVAFGAGCLGAILMGVLVGDIGVALMGTAFGISGIALGFFVGLVAVLVTWLSGVAVRAKRSGATN